jgi:hypothetical protein
MLNRRARCQQKTAGQRRSIMQNIQSLLDAFIDLMNDLYYPGYVMDMTAEQFTYEFTRFKAAHSAA